MFPPKQAADTQQNSGKKSAKNRSNKTPEDSEFSLFENDWPFFSRTPKQVPYSPAKESELRVLKLCQEHIECKPSIMVASNFLFTEMAMQTF